MSTLGAIPPNEKAILKRDGNYASRKTNKRVPGGAGANSAWVGKRSDEAEKKDAPLASNLARCFGQDLMRGEHIVGSHTSASASAMELAGGFGESQQSGTSIFDPVLCELAYLWFCPAAPAKIIDPFAGGSVRGIVAACMGHQYTGIDLSGRQLEENRKQAITILKGMSCPVPTWIEGDSTNIQTFTQDTFDMIFSCPPYGDLEVYSDLASDLSTMQWNAFCTAYYSIIERTASLLKQNRFAVFVVGNYRAPDGFYHDLCGLTIDAFVQAGCGYYNEAILVTAVGSLPIRVGRQFSAGRKLGKTHQNMLCFFKGDPSEIKKDFPRLELVEDVAGSQEMRVKRPEMLDG